MLDPRTAEHQLERLLVRKTAELAAETDLTMQLRAEVKLVTAGESWGTADAASGGPTLGSAQQSGIGEKRRDAAKRESSSKSKRGDSR